ncbi:MAG TPA: hypothetical protein VF021_02520 [Longimicrobiales bacterium]
MFGSNILDTVIGLILIFLIMSLICSALREIIESALKQRALDLERGIRELLQDDDGDGLACDLYSHPLVFGLYTGGYTPREKTRMKRWFGGGGTLPSYIPSDHFARAILDLDQQGKIDSPAMHAVLRTLSQEARSLGELRANVEAWFNSSTERIGGWYKRRTQVVLLGLGLVAAAALNVNPINIAQSLYKDADLRAAVTATAEKFAAAPNPSVAADSGMVKYSQNVKELHELAAAGLPLGWKGQRPSGWGWPIAFLGWLITAVAVTLGAPFWFDLLNKFMTLRSTVKPRPREPEPAAEPAAEQSDRSQAARKALINEVVAAKAVSPEAVPALVGAYHPNEWRIADEEEGDL